MNEIQAAQLTHDEIIAAAIAAKAQATATPARREGDPPLPGVQSFWVS